MKKVFIYLLVFALLSSLLPAAVAAKTREPVMVLVRDEVVVSEAILHKFNLEMTTSRSAKLQQTDQGSILLFPVTRNKGTRGTLNYRAPNMSGNKGLVTDASERKLAFLDTESTLAVPASRVGNKCIAGDGTITVTPCSTENLLFLKHTYSNESQSEPPLTIQVDRINVQDNYIQEENSSVEVLEPFIAVETDKKTYLEGENVNMKVFVTSQSESLAGERVVVTITSPNGSKQTAKGITDHDGTITFILFTEQNSLKGRYEVTANTTLESNEFSEAVTSFYIR